jgi:hypothetical protein
MKWLGIVLCLAATPVMAGTFDEAPTPPKTDSFEQQTDSFGGDDAKIKLDANWTFMRQRTSKTSGRCIVYADYAAGKQVKAEFGVTEMRLQVEWNTGSWYVSVMADNWKITDDRTYDGKIIFQMPNGRYEEYERATWLGYGDKQLSAKATEGFIADFAKATAVLIYVNNKSIGVYPLTGSSAAVGAAYKCSKTW